MTNKVTSKEAINVLLHHKEAFELSGKTAEAIDLAVSALKKQEQNRWIQCNERLPELGVDVLITDEYGDVLQATYTEWLGSESFISAEESIIIEDVIAWRPLPEPYMEEEA